MVMSQRSRPSGWQNGINSCVRLAAIVPATIAVWNTGPFDVAKPCASSVANASCGKRTRASARAARKLGSFAVTSTIAGAPSAPTCESLFIASSANVVHLHLARPRRLRRSLAQLAVAVFAPAPDRLDQRPKLRVFSARAEPRAEVRAGGREQAGVEDA